MSIALLALLASSLIPAQARTKPVSKSLQCLENIRRLGLAWLMYADDNRGKLVYNSFGDTSGRQGSETWVGGWLDFTSSPDNTNTGLLVNHDRYPYSAYFGPYVKTPVVFKCPSDQSLIRTPYGLFPRVRSVSMNSWVGEKAYKWKSATAFQTYAKLSAINRPAPANLWVIADEHPDSINDGVLLTDPDNGQGLYTIIDYPGSYHNGACSLVFADGHSELHKWRDPRTMPRPRYDNQMLLNVASPGNQDIAWLQAHATSKP